MRESRVIAYGMREFSSEGQRDFGEALRALMLRPTHAFTPGWLSKTSGIPKATIVNWLEGRVARPRSEDVLTKLCEALRLTPDERTDLYRAAGEELPTSPDPDAPFDRVPVGLYRTTLDGHILFANSTLVETLGYPSLRAYLDLHVARDLYARPVERARWLDLILASGTVRRYPVRARRADGAIVTLLDSAAAVRDREGNLLYFEGIWECTQ